MDRKSVLILAAALVLGGFLAGGGPYTASGTGNGTSLVVNRFTGAIWWCGGGNCLPMDR